MSREIQKSMVVPAALLTLLGIQLSLGVSESVAIDSPHNSNNTAPISCLTCHDAALSANTPTWWTDQESNVCGQCHGPAGTAKNVFTHKTGTVVLVQCTQCHNPHNQQQNRTWTTLSYLYTGVSTTVTATTLMTAATWTADYWKDHLLIPNTRYQSFNYRIAGNTANTITIVSKGVAPDNAINQTYGKAGSTFAIAYGKLVKENVNGKNVKYFRESGPNSYADDDATIDGICQVCHTSTTSFRNSGLLEGPGHPPLQAGKKCSTCHQHQSSFKANCKDCHGTPPLVNTIGGPNGLADQDGGTGSSTPGAHQKHVNQGYSCQTCHSSGMPYAPIEGTIYDKKIQIGFNIGEGTYRSGAYDGRSPLANEYTYAAGNAGTVITQNNAMTCRSVYCHTDGTAMSTGSVPDSTSPNWATGTTSCNTCHGFPPSYGSGSPKANSHGVHNYTCDNCHNATTTTGNSITNPAAHANAVYDLAPGTGKNFVYSFSFPNGTCSTVSCHSNTGTTWGGSACLDCHSIRQGNRAAVKADFNGNSHHIQGTEVTGAKCYQCHWEANADGSINTVYHGGSGAPGSAVNLVIYGAGARPTTYAAGATAIPYTANGSRSETEKITTHCLGCHSEQNNDTQPFGDGKTPRQYSWDDTSIELRYSQTGTTVWGKYSEANTTRKNFTKAYSAHGNAAANQRGWNTTTGTDDILDGNAANTSGSINVQCFDCHNSHGSTVQGVTTRYTSATLNGGILKDTTQDTGGYSVSYKPEAGGSQSDRNERNPGASLCLDCHLTQSAGSTRPWGYNSTFGAFQAIIGYWDSSLLTPGDAGPQQRYAYKTGKPAANKGGHFGKSSELQSTPMQTIGGLCTPCHDPHGVSPGLGNDNKQYAVPLLKGTWVTAPYKEDAAPARNVAQTNFAGFGDGVGYHIDQNTFGSSIRDTVSGVTQTAAQFAGLCLTCHPQTTLTAPAVCSNPAYTTASTCIANGGTWSPNPWKSKDRIHESVKGWKTSDSTVKHNYTCSKCHSPHNGSALPRLMTTNCLDSSHKGRTGFSVPVNSSAYSYSGGYGGGGGSGRIPGSYSGGGDDPTVLTYFGMPQPGNMTVSCHESPTANGGNGLDQGWNVKTPWAEYPPIGITSGPSAGQFMAAGSNVQAAITWSTNIPSDSRVNFGLTTGYGSTTTLNNSTINHSVTIQNLTNHTIYHYQVTSISGDSQQISSADASFSLSVPPSVPIPIAQTVSYCTSNCQLLLQWNPSTDPDNGPIQYRVQLSQNYLFSIPLYDSGWVSDLNVTTSSVAANQYYYWRVQARDADHPADAVSAWSPAQYVQVTDDRPVINDWSISAGTYTSSGSDIMATISWSTDKAATSWVDYGTTSLAYTQSMGTDSPLLWSHSVVVHNLMNHATNYYRVRSAGGTLNAETASVEHTFFISIPPSVPVLVQEPNAPCEGSCAVTLEWNASLDPDNGPIEYHVQASTHPAFGITAYDSGWTSGTSVNTSGLATNNTYYWRVQARDAVATAAVSAWSSPGSFTLESVPVITAGPAAGSFAATTLSNGTAAITWTTDIASTSCVDYGLTESYGTSLCTGGSVRNHSVTIGSLTNHTTYHYRVRSAGSFSNEAISGDSTFFFSVPPTIPLQVDEQNVYCPGTCDVTLQWNPSTDPDGGPVSYNLQLSIDPAFGTINSSISNITGTSVVTSLATGTTWNWRVQAFDGNHPATLSAWSSVDMFKLMTAEPPVAPTVVPHGHYDSGCADTVVTVQWNPVTSPDGHGVQYRVTSDSGLPADSGWLPIGQTTWQFTNYAAYGVTWRVMARDSVHTDAESPWSASDYFYDIGSGCYSGSCPLVFAWDGTAYAYITDLQGPVIGLPPANLRKDPRRYQPVYAVLDGLVPDAEERYRVKLRESLAENTYVDEARLLVAELPSGYDIETSSAENTYNYDYVEPFTLYTVKDPVLPLSGKDKNGNSVLASVLAVDNQPAPVSDNALDHYTFDFGPISRPEHARLLIDGWSVYGVKKFRSDTTTQPFIELVDKNGAWVKVRSMGTPAGDLKTMMVDLSGLFLSPDHRVRVHLGLRKGSRWVIDRIRLDDSEPVQVTVQELGASSADLQLAGVAVQRMGSVNSRIIASDQNLPLDPSNLGYGSFTRYGETAPLLLYRDDKYVVMRHGDQLDLVFPSMGPPAPGKKRVFVLKTDLYYKSFEVSRNVEPMPFHGMTAYPYPAPEAYPADPEHQQYLLNYNTREYPADPQADR